MKQCKKCQQVKILSDFYKDNRRPDGHESSCKKCHSKGSKEQIVARRKRMLNKIHSDPEYKMQHRANQYKAAARQRALNRDVAFNYEMSHPCITCGESDFRVLQFHHRDPMKKKFNISSSHGWSTELFQQELEKCDILCANCHWRLHYQDYRNRTWTGLPLKDRL